MDQSNIIDAEITGETTNEEIDILKQMQDAAAYKPEVKEIHISGNEPGKENTDDDFETAPEPEPEPEETENEGGIDASDLTDLIIDGSDMLIEGVLPFLYRKTIDKEDLQTMNEISRIYRQAKEQKQKVLEFTERQQEVMEIHIEYEDYVHNLPLTSKEKKNLRKPLKKLLTSVNFKASPENTLMAVAAMIFLPRLLPLGGRLLFNKDEKK